MKIPPIKAPEASTLPTPVQVKDAQDRLWRAGHIATWKLDPSQRDLYKEILTKRDTARAHGKAPDRVVVLAGRGWGKSYIDFLMLVETCLQGIPVRDKDGKAIRIDPAHVAFVTKTKKQGVKNLMQTVDEVLEGAPRAIRPIWNKTDAEYIFKNGSTLALVGVDAERYDFLRGRALDGCVIDESQDVDNLEYIVKTILDPCVLRRGGWMVLTGTVPQRDTHDFVQFVRLAIGQGQLIRRTTMDCPRYKPEQKQQMLERSGGAESNTWKREYMVELVFSDERQVIQEWSIERAQKLTAEQPRPEFCDKYVGLDFGFQRDLTVALFGYWDFARTTLVIEDECIMKGCTTAGLAALIEGKLTELWGSSDQRTNVSLFADGNEARTLFELRTLHKLPFKATDKKDKKMAINGVRMLIAQNRILVSPKCQTLIKTLHQATWNRNFDSYSRDDSEIGHADALDALCYLFRNVKQGKNPVVQHPNHWTNENRPGQPVLSNAAKTLGSCFGNSGTDIRKAVSGKLGKRRF